MNKFLLYCNTLKYLKFKQIFFRIWYLVYQPRIIFSKSEERLTREIKVRNKDFFLVNKKRYFTSSKKITLLNHTVCLNSDKIWNDCNQEKLWLYNLHYFDSLNASNPKECRLAYALLQIWSKKNLPHKKGNAWEPYTISLRTINIIKYSISGNALSKNIEKLLYFHARILNKKCEYHILGNHLFENFKALCFSGLYFKGREASRWLKKGLSGIDKEVQNQIHPDGGHFELSPMYHCIVLEGLMDLHAMCKLYGVEQLFIWEDIVKKMLFWLLHMARNNHSISYFNDASDNIAHNPADILSYAKILGYDITNNIKQLTYLSDSGYIIVQRKSLKVILDVAHIGPTYLPGHGHADTLSFELMIDGFPVFVNLGTSCYSNSERRRFERGTQSHNTVAVGKKDSSEVWSSFRVARRANPKLLYINQEDENITISASHDGYKRLNRRLIHKRVLKVNHSSLIISDDIDLLSYKATGYLHLHPTCKIKELGENKCRIVLPSKRCISIEITAGRYSIINSYYAQSFGELRKTNSICYELKDNKKSTIEIKLIKLGKQ